MAYRGRVKTIKPMGKGRYFVQSQSVGHWGCMSIITLPFKLIYWMFKYTIGLPFVIASRISKKSK